jgi:class 3 adenylate cyclase
MSDIGAEDVRATAGGVHTFLFADLAGYTALTEVHGDAQAAEAAAEFFEDVRLLLAEYRAEEVKAIGDALMLRTATALDATQLAERIVCGRGWRHRALGVRLGMHTGTAVRQGDDWFGSAVNIASRVADAAHAGEVLLTEDTRQALGDSIAVRPRGQKRFKNLAKLFLCMNSPSRRGTHRAPSLSTPFADWRSSQTKRTRARPTAGLSTTFARRAASRRSPPPPPAIRVHAQRASTCS